MLARRLPGLLPTLTRQQALGVAAIHSAAGLPLPARLDHIQRPFRAPHHSASAGALLGSPQVGRPGEITLAHEGVLFLDEVQELPRRHLHLLSGPVRRRRAEALLGGELYDWPADTQLVTATSELPGRDHPLGAPLREFLAQHFAVAVQLDPSQSIAETPEGESSATVRERVTAARAFGAALSDGLGACDAILGAAYGARGWSLAPGSARHLAHVARAIANLDQSAQVLRRHVDEAITFVGPVA